MKASLPDDEVEGLCAHDVSGLLVPLHLHHRHLPLPHLHTPTQTPARV